MLWIQNVTPGERPDNEPHDYVVRINREPPLGVFRHVRELGAAECLRAAANTIDGKPTPPAAVVEAMERALRPFAFFNEDNANEDIQTAWETRYRDRFRDWIDFGDIEAVRAALAALTAWKDAQ